jgi:Mrp family chromosome partitioning ATPase
MTELLAWAGANYGLVILDTPPSRLLPDARILAASVDCVLYCARWGHSTQESVVDGARAIQAAGGRVLGLVLGRVRQTQYRQYNSGDLGLSSYPALTGG